MFQAEIFSSLGNDKSFMDPNVENRPNAELIKLLIQKQFCYVSCRFVKRCSIMMEMYFLLTKLGHLALFSLFKQCDNLTSDLRRLNVETRLDSFATNNLYTYISLNCVISIMKTINTKYLLTKT